MNHVTRAVGRARRLAGFTLIELVVVIAIVAVLLALATPYFGNAALNGQLTGLANTLVATMSQARGEAIKRNATATLCMSSDGATCTTTGGWEQGWILKAMVSGTDTVLHSQPAAPGGFKITETIGGATSIAFPPIGLMSSSYAFKVCRATPSVGAQDRSVTLSTTGRVGVTKTATGTCS